MLANVNSLLHVEIMATRINAHLFMAPINETEGTIDYARIFMIGRNRLATVRQGRIKRSRSLLTNKRIFLLALWWDITSLQCKAINKGMSAHCTLPDDIPAHMLGFRFICPNGHYRTLHGHFDNVTFH